jgi:hypothetical protein
MLSIAVHFRMNSPKGPKGRWEGKQHCVAERWILAHHKFRMFSSSIMSGFVAEQQEARAGLEWGFLHEDSLVAHPLPPAQWSGLRLGERAAIPR